MKNTFEKYIAATNSDDAQKVIDKLRAQALKDCPEMTAEQWQRLKCFIVASAIAKIEND